MEVKTKTALGLAKGDNGVVEFLGKDKILVNKLSGNYLKLCSVADCRNVMNVKGKAACNTHAGYRPMCERCSKSPSFGQPGTTKALRCKDHVIEGDVDVRHDKCQLCGKNPCFGPPGTTKALRCKEHKIEGDVNVVSDKCQLCGKLSSFGQPGTTKALRCKDHVIEGDVDVRHEKCQLCGKTPCFGPPGTTKGLRCKDHMEDGDVDVIHNRCQLCSKHPSLGLVGTTKALRCKDHMLEGDVNVRHDKCQLCGKTPCFGPPEATKALRCKDHRIEGDVDIIHDACQLCSKRPSFGPAGTTKALRCKDHMLEGDVNVVNDKCQLCGKCSVFGLPGTTKGLRCKEHRIDGDVDVVHNKCKLCQITAKFGLLFESARHCARHKSRNEFRYRHPKCIVPNCVERPCYTHDRNTGYPVRCETHHLPTDVDVVQRPCNKCGLSYYIPSGRTECNDCFKFFVQKMYHCKENEIHQLILSTDISRIFRVVSHDRIVEDGCSKYRPDVILTRAGYYIIVEIDEHQHETYPKDCENTRMKQIYHDFGGAEVLFIRYNPDKYTSPQGSMVGKTDRHLYLLGLLRLYSNIESLGYPLGVTYLFYDGFDVTKPSVLSPLDPYQVSPAFTPSEYQALESTIDGEI